MKWLKFKLQNYRSYFTFMMYILEQLQKGSWFFDRAFAWRGIYMTAEKAVR